MEKEQKNKKKTSKKESKILKVVTCTLAGILFATVAIFGVYTQKQNRMDNLLNGYSYGMDLKGGRTLILTPSTETSSIVKDSEGNEVENSSELTDEEIAQNGYTKEEVADNQESDLTVENYKNSKEIIEKRLKELDVKNYNISLNEETGEITIILPEDENTDDIASELTTVGKFEIIDTETNEVLMNNDDIKESKVLSGASSTGSGTMVYIDILFDKEGKQKFKDITTNYKTVENTTTENTTAENTTTDNATSTETEGNTTTENTASTDNTTTENTTTDNTTTEDTTSEDSESSETETQKEIALKIDDEELMTTSFEDVIETGEMTLSIGSATTEQETYSEYVKNATQVATVLNNGKMPVKYNVTKNEYILSDVTRDTLHKIEFGIIIVTAIALIILVIKYRLDGFIAAIGYVGLASIYSIVIRYTNVTITLEGILGIAITLILNYAFSLILLKKVKESKQNQEEEAIKKATKKTYKEYFLKIMPISIMAVVFTLFPWEPISSIGMVTFWGIALIAIYNILITKNLLKINKD